MSGIRYWFRSFLGMIMFCTGFGGALAMLAMADYYKSPIPFVFAIGGVFLGVLGRTAEKRAARQLVVDRAVDGK